MVAAPFASGAELYARRQPFRRSPGLLTALAGPPQLPPTAAGVVAAPPPALLLVDAAQPAKRSPLLCGYPSKKCWSWRVEKRNGELHKFCEYHRQKANTNQRRMEQRRKLGQGKPRPARAVSNASLNNNHNNSLKVAVTAPPAPPAIKSERADSGSPRGVDVFDGASAAAADATAAYSWMDVELDVGLDAAVEYMLFDPAAIDMEPSDKPVDLYEEDLFFLEHFIDEIAHSAV